MAVERRRSVPSTQGRVPPTKPTPSPRGYRRWRLPSLKVRKPPQLVRWDLLGVLLSNLWGAVNKIPLPVWLRIIIYNMWAFVYGVNLDEIDSPLESFPTLRDFFSRPMKEGCRKITQEGMASPVDAKVVVFGEVKAERVEQVKGVTYPLTGFLGADPATLKTSPNKKLYHCVLYLAPGDYHRFHSPADWTITKRRHFPGTLFPISPSFAKFVPNLLAPNERIVLSGEWEHGFYSLTPVGAYNVGSMTLKFDQKVKTNNLRRDFRCPNLQYFSFGGVGSHAYEYEYPIPVQVKKGEEIGLFNLGSTVVLVFESEDFEFKVKVGDKIKVGQLVGNAKATTTPGQSTS